MTPEIWQLIIPMDAATDWIQGANTITVALGVLILGILTLLISGVKKLSELIIALGEMKRELDSVKKKASTASHAATSAAASSQKIDQSMHTNNGGSHVRDEMDLLKKANVKMNEKLDIVIKNQAAQTEAMNTDRSTADMVHRELFRQVDEIRRAT